MRGLFVHILFLSKWLDLGKRYLLFGDRMVSAWRTWVAGAGATEDRAYVSMEAFAKTRRKNILRTDTSRLGAEPGQGVGR
jgi:hypothetical protein